METKVKESDFDTLKEIMLSQDRDLSNEDFELILAFLDGFQELIKESFTAPTLLPDERRRFSSIGIKRISFVYKALELWDINPQFAPPYLDKEEVDKLMLFFGQGMKLINTVEELLELLTDIRIVYSSRLYRDALSYYDSVQQAATVGRTPDALATYRALNVFFKQQGRRINGEEKLTQEKVIADAKALLKGTKDGKIVLEHQTPKKEKSKHVVIDRMENIREDVEITKSTD